MLGKGRRDLPQLRQPPGKRVVKNTVKTKLLPRQITQHFFSDLIISSNCSVSLLLRTHSPFASTRIVFFLIKENN